MKQNDLNELMSKVPQVTLLFWITKIFATTFGETAGDAVSMSMNLGYLLSTFIFAFVFIAFVFFQIRAKSYHPYLYWFTIIASTTVGTTLADFVDRSLGIGYLGGSTLLLSLVLLSLFIWYKVEGTISPHIQKPRAEFFIGSRLRSRKHLVQHWEIGHRIQQGWAIQAE